MKTSANSERVRLIHELHQAVLKIRSLTNLAALVRFAQSIAIKEESKKRDRTEQRSKRFPEIDDWRIGN
jgi:hypothetical protein